MPDESNAQARIEQSLDDLLAQYIVGEESGNTPDRQELLRQHPQFAGELREFFANRDQMQRLAEPLRGNVAAGRPSGPLGKLRYFGDYELLEEVAAGGMGIVYKARQLSLNRIVAIKMILKGTLAREDDVKRFRAEAEAAASLQHPAIVAIHEVGLHEGQHYFSMDYVDGHSLAELPREQPLSTHRAAEYIRDAAEAVHYAHQQGTLHRDLKPSNILIDRQGRVRITDFGLAKRIGDNSDLTLTGQILGTPSYMPPEQATSKRSLVGAASDIYSLGAVLYELLTGRPPFRGESPAETLRQVELLDPVSPRMLSPATPRDLETICLRCLEKEPHKRYGTAQLLADDLGRYLRGEPIVARPLRAWQRGVKWVRRHPTAAGLVVTSLVAVLAVVGLMVGRTYNERLQTVNDQLESAKSSLETRNEQLSTAKIKLETTNDQLKEASGKLAKALDDVTAERARARKFLYTATMALVARAEQEQQRGRVVQLLRSLIPETTDQEDLRDFEWHHLWRKYCGAELHLRGHTSPVTAVAVSPDNQWAASGGEDGVIKLWQPDTGKELHTLVGHQERITALAFAPANKGLISASAGKLLKLWDPKTGELVRSFEEASQRIVAIAFTPEGRHIATGSDDGEILVWKLNTGERIELGRREGLIRGLAFSLDGSTLWIAAGNSLETCKPFEGGPYSIQVTLQSSTNVAFSHTAEFSVSGQVASSKLGLRQRTMPIKSTVTNLDFRPNKEPLSMEITGAVVAVAISPDGTTFAAAISEGGENTVRVWEKPDNRETYVHHDQSPIRSIAFSGDGAHIAAGTDDGTVVISSLPGRASRIMHQAQSQATCVTFGDQGRLLGATCSDGIVVWDLSTGYRVGQWPTARYQRMAISPTTALIAGAPPSDVADISTGQRIALANRKESRANSGGPYGYAFSKDGKLLAEAPASGPIQLWEADSGRHLKAFPLDGYTTCVAFSPDGYWLAGGSSYGSMQVWGTASALPVSPKIILPFGVWGLAFSPDGKLLAAGLGLYGEHGPNTNAVRVWNTSTWEAIYDLRGHSECVWSVAFNPAGTRLASASSQWNTARRPKDHHGFIGEIKVWDVSTGHEVLTIADESGGMFSVDFSPDGLHLATATQTGFVRILNGTPLPNTSRFEPITDEVLKIALPALPAKSTDSAAGATTPPVAPNATQLAANATIRPSPPPPPPPKSADQLSKEGRWALAIVEYSKIIERQPDHQGAWRGRAWAKFNLRRWDEAIADFQGVLRLQPYDAWAMAITASCLRNKGELEAAIAEYEKALQLEPYRAASHYELGLTHAAQRSWDETIVAYQEAIRIKPDYHEAFYGLGIALRKLAKFDEAIAADEESIRLKPDYAAPHNNLAWLLITCPETRLRDSPRAVRLAKKATELTPKSDNYWNTLGVSHYRAGSWQEAIAALEKSEEIAHVGRSFGYNSLYLAMSHRQLGDWEKARKWYDQAAQWIEKNKESLEKDGRAKEIHAAEAEAAELLEIQPPAR